MSNVGSPNGCFAFFLLVSVSREREQKVEAIRLGWGSWDVRGVFLRSGNVGCLVKNSNELRSAYCLLWYWYASDSVERRRNRSFRPALFTAGPSPFLKKPTEPIETESRTVKLRQCYNVSCPSSTARWLLVQSSRETRSCAPKRHLAASIGKTRTS